MKKLLLSLSVGVLFLASSLAGRAGTDMAPSPNYNSQNSGAYAVQPPPYPPPTVGVYYPPAPYYYAPPPPYYYGYGPGPYYYAPGPVGVYGPGIFLGFGFHGRR